MNNAFLSRNSYYEGLLQNLYAGSSGCFSFLMKLFYQYNQVAVYSKENLSLFESLLECELENCKLLGQSIIEIGGDNKYYTSAKKFLSGASVDYCKSFEQMFMSDIETLETHVIELKNLISKIENLQIREKLKKILSNKQQNLRKIRENYFKNNLI